MDRRPNIFIASSQEALPIARAVKRQFDDEADVDVWAEDIFKANRNYLDTLLNRASYYDYFVAVFAPDDAITERKKVVKVTRDNVIFEFGLFLGRLGPNRTFLILQEGVDLFSDWSGIDIAKFRSRPDGNLVAAVGVACEKIRAQMKEAEKLPHFTSLPSTALAMGYYNNFLKRVFDAFEFSDTFSVVERDQRGQILKETTHRITDRRPTIHVQLPHRLEDLEPDRLKERTSAYRQISVATRFREFPFYIGGDPKQNARKINLFDIPTTMLSSKIAIERVFTPEFLAQGRTAEALERREIANFERTLRIMVPDKIEKKYFKFSILK
jgi:Predicted nucleotide-binding protein containing TIR-like domain